MKIIFCIFVLLFCGCSHKSIGIEGANLCGKAWRSDYSEFTVAYRYLLKGERMMNSFELYLNCDRTFKYTGLCDEFVFNGKWDYNAQSNNLVLSLGKKSLYFPRTYHFESGKLLASYKMPNGDKFREQLKPYTEEH